MKRLLSAVGPDGAFLSAGTACLATAASFVSPAGPWFVVGVALIAVGVLYALPVRRT